MNAPTMTDYDAMMLTIVMVEAFLSLPWQEMTVEHQRGALLLFDQVLGRATPLLPRTPAMAHVFAGIETARGVANRIRATVQAPARIG